MPGGAGLAVANDFDEHAVGVDVQPAMLLAFAGDQADFLAAVAVRDRAAERRFDPPSLPVVQDHRGRDDARRAGGP